MTIHQQLDLFQSTALVTLDPVTGFDVHSYDRYVVFFSGGKDSVACVLQLLEEGVDPSRIELHHHLVDGSKDDVKDGFFMDWPVTTDYCRKFAEAFGMRIFFSWKEGGFKREMNRDGDRTAPISFEDENGEVITSGGERGKEGVRRKFPQQSPSLVVRWCSSYLKVDVGERLLRRSDRFSVGRTLVVTGERAQESAARANYKTLEPHRADSRGSATTKRFIDHWRPVHGLNEQEVWDLIRKYRVRPHPAYEAGYGRVSCINCIFANKHQWATNRKYAPEQFRQVAAYEASFGVTISRAGKTVGQLADEGMPYPAAEHHIATGLVESYDLPIITDNWEMPAGAFSEGCGPT